MTPGRFGTSAIVRDWGMPSCISLRLFHCRQSTPEMEYCDAKASEDRPGFTLRISVSVSCSILHGKSLNSVMLNAF